MRTRWRSRPICSACRRCMPPIARNTLTFPFNQRWSMVVWSLLFNRERALQAQPVAKPGMEPRRLSRRGARALRRMPHAAQSRLRARQPPEIRRRGHGRLACLQHHVRQRLRHRRLERRRSDRLSLDRSRVGPRHGGGADGRGGRPELQPADAGGHPRAGRLSAQRARDRVVRSAGDACAAGAGFSQSWRRHGGHRGQASLRRRLRQLSRLDGRERDHALCDDRRHARRERPQRHQCRADRHLRHEALDPAGGRVDAGLRRQSIPMSRSRP